LTLGPIGSPNHKQPITRTIIIPFLLALAMMTGGCGSGDDNNLADVQLVGVDFELNSIMLTNGGAEDLLTNGLWIYQDGEAFELSFFTIKPRTTIFFSVRDLDGIDPSGGEIALFSSDSFEDEEAVLDYVAWGTSGHHLVDTGVVSGVWSEIGPVEVPGGTVALIRFDPQFFGPDGWEPFTGDE
jgi:hypothetical protein